MRDIIGRVRARATSGIVALLLLSLSLTLSLSLPLLTGCAFTGSGESTLGGPATGGSDSFALTSPDGAVVTSPVGVDVNNTYIASNITVDYSSFDLDASETADKLVTVTLADEATAASGSGATYGNGVLTVSAGGTYRLTGTLHGRIVVDVPETEKVKLILAGVNVTCTSDSAIYAACADKLLLCLAAGTKNVVCDSDTRIESDADTRGNAAIYACCSLTVNGEGELEVSSSYKHGIASKKNIRIISGTVTVDAVDVGIKGNNSVAVAGGVITVDSGADGIKTEEIDDTEKGYVLIEGGRVKVTAVGDGIAGSLYVSITGGELDITTTGKVAASSSRPGGFAPSSSSSASASASVASSKGIKAEMSLSISGGSVTVVSTSHAIHSSGEITFSGDALINLTSSSGKGVSGHGNVTVAGGSLTVKRATEGIESKAVLTINGGVIRLENCSDDGLNAGGGSSGMGGMFGGGASSGTGTHEIYINGGYLYINASGDGIDSNGNITVTGGTTIVAGPTNNGNGALDKGDGNYTIKFTGGTLIAYGSTGMAEAPSTVSSQCSISITPGNTAAGKLFYLCDQDGNVVVAFTAQKQWANVVITSPLLEMGKTYTAYTGGTVDGNVSDGYYTSLVGASGGTQVGTYTLTSIVTGGSSGGGVGGGPGGRPGGQPGGGRY